MNGEIICVHDWGAYMSVPISADERDHFRICMRCQIRWHNAPTLITSDMDMTFPRTVIGRIE